MRSQHSLEEIAELYGLLENIKKEYEDGIHSVLRKSNPELFSNPHTIPKLKKININRGLGLAAQNKNILKKNITEFTRITGQKPLITRAKKAVAGFKIRQDIELGLSSTLRGEKMYNYFLRLLLQNELLAKLVNSHYKVKIPISLMLLDTNDPVFGLKLVLLYVARASHISQLLLLIDD